MINERHPNKLVYTFIISFYVDISIDMSIDMSKAILIYVT